MDNVGGIKVSGILSNIIPGNLPIKLSNNEIVIELTAKDLYDMLTKDLNPQQKQAIVIDIVDNKLVIRVRLF